MLLIGLGVAFPAFANTNAAGDPWYSGFAPIAFILMTVGFIIWRLPEVKPDKKDPHALDHRKDNRYVRRRTLNWLMLGLTYAFLYWGRYNINIAKNHMGLDDANVVFNDVFMWGAATYGLAFILNGPLTDHFGGRFSILMGAAGATVANLLMGVLCILFANGTITMEQTSLYLTIAYAMNMYFQSFGAVAIVKTNSPWFHVNERGVFGSIFGILISLGVYFAFDWSSTIAVTWDMDAQWTFFFPAVALAAMFVIDFLFVRNKPEEAGLYKIKTGDQTSGEEDAPQMKPWKVLALMMSNWVIVCIALIEFCSGFLRQAIMHQYKNMTKAVPLLQDSFMAENWGMALCIAGILGGVFAGTISDHVFKSKRGPVAAVLYTGMLAGSIGAYLLIDHSTIGHLMVFMSLCVIGVHGMLSGTASMDFGGSKNAGIAVGLIDAFVYFGTSLQSWLYGKYLPTGPDAVGADDPNNWVMLPKLMIPFAVAGLLLALLIRNQKPESKEDKKKRLAKEQDDLPTEEVA